MTDQNSSTPLDREISAVEHERVRELRLIHRIQAMVRDASTNCEIDGYVQIGPTETGRIALGEWQINQGEERLRLILVKLP